MYKNVLCSCCVRKSKKRYVQVCIYTKFILRRIKNDINNIVANCIILNIHVVEKIFNPPRHPSPPNYSTSTSIFRHHHSATKNAKTEKLAFFWSPSTPWCMIIKKVAKCQKKSVPNLCRSPPNYIYWLLPPTFSEQRRPWSLSTRMRANATQNNIYYHHPLLVMLNWYIVLSLLKQKLMMNKITFFTKNRKKRHLGVSSAMHSFDILWAKNELLFSNVTPGYLDIETNWCTLITNFPSLDGAS